MKHIEVPRALRCFSGPVDGSRPAVESVYCDVYSPAIDGSISGMAAPVTSYPTHLAVHSLVIS